MGKLGDQNAARKMPNSRWIGQRVLIGYVIPSRFRTLEARHKG
jgi:hypothetical protein